MSLAATALLGRIAPFATGATVTMPPDAMAMDVTLGAMDLTRTARRLSITNLAPQGVRNPAALVFFNSGATTEAENRPTAQLWSMGGGDVTRATGELPMRAVTVGDPPDPDGLTGAEEANSHLVHIYMPGARIVDTGAGGANDANPIEAGAVQRVRNATTSVLQTTQDRRQYDTYVLSDADVVSSIELDGDRGVTVKLGGANEQGLAFADMKTGTEARPSGDAGKRGTALRQWAERNHGDLTIKLGKDAYGPDPHGDGAHYWEADVEFAVGGTDDDADGTYQLWLSNQAGAVSTENAEYLQYAAYGLFNFMDRTLEATPTCTGIVRGFVADVGCGAGEGAPYTPVSARLQGLHFGYDTPWTGMDSLATLRALPGNDRISATWSGRTTALAMRTTGARFYEDSNSPNGVGLRQLWDCRSGATCYATGVVPWRNPTEELVRMRGDVKLYACFGASGSCTIAGAPGHGNLARNDPAGSTAANRIEGAITNLQAFAIDEEGNGVWRSTTGGDPFHAEQITLVSSFISVNGTFGHGIDIGDDGAGGSVLPDDTVFGAGGRSNDRDQQRWLGAWGGRFYGPVRKADSAAFAVGDGPAEAAGWWYLPGDNQNNELHAIIGGFGAKLDDPPDPDPMTP